MPKQRVFRLVPYDEINNVWLLKEKVWWIFYKFISAGSKKDLMIWVTISNGRID